LRSWFGDKQVLIPEPSFGEYSRVFPQAARYRDDTVVVWADVERSAVSADVVVFVNPNNPTGTALATDRIADFARRNQEKWVLVDESFIEFSDEASIVAQLDDPALANVLVIKSLSKTLGAPGLRLGALLTANPELSDRIRTETPIWNLSSVAENFLEIMLKHRPALEESYLQTAADRDEFALLLKEVSLVDTVFPSGGDFLLVRLSVDAAGADAVARRLVEEHEILVKDVSDKMADGAGYWRLAVRTPADHRRLLSALRSGTAAA
jgi:histidinol-phosphate/aromatic aminotransferase/cobyric acid decarboxylase-like protein